MDRRARLMASVAADTRATANRKSPLADDPQTPQAGLEAVFQQVSGRIRKLVAGMGLGPDADDILMDVFVQASQRPPEARGHAATAAWLMRVAANRCMLEFRGRQRFRRHAREVLRRQSAGGRPPPDALAREEELEAVREALQQLEPALLAPLVLRYFCELNSVQISEILQIPPGTVRSHLRTGRMILAERLIKRGFRP
jgi:RNA polymerase sigma factor (sigma-70 family)